MMYELKENILTAKDYLQLRVAAGWGGSPTEQQIESGLKNSLVTISAVYENRIIGMGRLIGDGFITCYIQDLIVCPEYQGKGIGKELVRLITENYKDYLRIVLVAYDEEIGFYQNCGFEVGTDKTPMFITSLWT